MTAALPKTRSYRDLIVWQKAMDLSVEFYALTASFPSGERYGLVSQIRRAAASIAANIAEGHERTHRGEYLHFLSIARGSLGELETHLLLTVRLGFKSEAEVAALLNRCDELGRMLRHLVRRLGD